MTDRQQTVVRELINNSDIFKVNDKPFLNHEASKRVAEFYGIRIDDDRACYSLDDVIALIMQMEIENEAELQAQPVEEVSNDFIDEVVGFIEMSEDMSVYLLSKELLNKFSELNASDLILSIKKASELGVISNEKELVDALYDAINSRSIISQINQMNASNDVDKINRIASVVLGHYNNGVRYGKLKIALSDSELSDDDIEKVIDCIYNGIAPKLIETYENSTGDVGAIAGEFEKTYEDFDMGRILSIVGLSSKSKFDFDEFSYNVYKKDDEKAIIAILLRASSESLSAVDIKAKIDELETEYSVAHITRTIEKLRAAGLLLPYPGLFELLSNVPIVEQTEADSYPEQFQDHIADGLPPARREIEILDAEEVTELPSEPQVNSNRNRFKIIDRKKEASIVEKRRNIGLFFAGAGAVATAALSFGHKINPVVAARNIWEAFSSFGVGTVNFSQLVPSAAYFVATTTFIIAALKTLKDVRAGNISEEKVSFFDQPESKLISDNIVTVNAEEVETLVGRGDNGIVEVDFGRGRRR